MKKFLTAKLPYRAPDGASLSSVISEELGELPAWDLSDLYAGLDTRKLPLTRRTLPRGPLDFLTAIAASWPV